MAWVPKGRELGSGNVCSGRRWASGGHEVLIGPESRSGRNQDGEDAAQFEMVMISIRDRGDGEAAARRRRLSQNSRGSMAP